MSSTFFGLTIAGSGLSSFQTAINTTANNISNVQTDGYSKQVANRVASEALRVNQKYGTTGTGVTTTSITQLRDTYYDVKYWDNSSKLGYYDKKVYYMDQIQSYFTDDETSQKGFSTILNNMFSYLDTLKNNSGDSNVRNQFIGSAQNLSSYFTGVADQLHSLQSSCNDEIKTTVGNVNSISSKIATLNKQINQIEISGGYANELRDQRALLVDELSQIVPVTVNEAAVVDSNNPDRTTGATYYTVSINGQNLVDNYDYTTLECKAREYKSNQSDVDGLYDIYWSDTGTYFNASGSSMSGQLKALFEMRDGNNEQNFQGTLTSIDGNKAVFSTNLSITSTDDLNMPAEGVITIGNKDFTYSGFSYTTTKDSEGNETITSYSFNLTDTSGSALNSYVGKTGEVGTSVDALGATYYLNQLDAFVRSFASKFNELEKTGVDLNGDDMGAFFVANLESGEVSFDDYTTAMKDGATQHTYTIGADTTTSSDTYYWLTGSNFGVAQATVKDPNKFATISKENSTGGLTEGVDAYDVATELLKLKSDVNMYRSCGADDFLQCLISDISVDKQEADVFQENYTNISKSIVAQRKSISGVDEDEEALDLVKFQNAYNLASQMVQVMTEMYDQLILQTGV